LKAGFLRHRVDDQDCQLLDKNGISHDIHVFDKKRVRAAS
jgi:hypothetical protein